MTLQRVSLREEWFVDADENTHSRIIDPEDGAVFCDFDNEFWPCSGAPAGRTAE